MVTNENKMNKSIMQKLNFNQCECFNFIHIGCNLCNPARPKPLLSMYIRGDGLPMSILRV